MSYDERMDTYLQTLSRGLPPFLEDLEASALSERVPLIRKDTQDVIRMLLALHKPERILEVGTAVGYSSLFMAGYLGGTTFIDTIELDTDMADEAEMNFRRFKRDDVITLHRGDASEILEDMAEQGGRSYDLVFIDAAKSQYKVYFSQAMRMVHPGSVIVTDNILESGLVLESHFLVEKRDRTIHDKLREYIYLIKNDERLETAILSVGDGIAVSVVKENV